jgi:Arc/MetJ family transcription regulator
VVIQMEDFRCKSLRYRVAIEMDDPRCMRTTIEMDDPRCTRTMIEMDDPRCRGLNRMW